MTVNKNKIKIQFEKIQNNVIWSVFVPEGASHCAHAHNRLDMPFNEHFSYFLGLDAKVKEQSFTVDEVVNVSLI